ncbi:unnamed protein product [Mesocestoides corti]|uniref:POU domain protein n=1 Tax=Mesocestoides corti TaxID=53468 RepID=A0A158QTI6_MESCO|nr:unnamed protein product [Mesocestoides corti]
MWPPLPSVNFPVLPPPPPPPLTPSFPLSVLLRCLVPPSHLQAPQVEGNASTPPLSLLSGRQDSSLDFGFSYCLPPQNNLGCLFPIDANHCHHLYAGDESNSRRAKRLHKSTRNDHDSAGSKKCKKISATSLHDTNEHIEDIRRFARAFKMKRLSLGLTQTQIGRALTAGDGPAYSQSAICRFEKLDITPKSAQRIKPVLERWLAELEGRRGGDQTLPTSVAHGDGGSVCDSLSSSQDDETIYRLESESEEASAAIRKRKSRTNFSVDALDRLNHEFATNTHPSGTRISQLANQLNYDREVIRVWFCNKRQSFRNSTSQTHPPNPACGSNKIGEQHSNWYLHPNSFDDNETPIDLSTKSIPSKQSLLNH